MNSTNDRIFFEIINSRTRKKVEYDENTKRFIKIINAASLIDKTSGLNVTVLSKKEFRNCTERDFNYSEEALKSFKLASGRYSPLCPD